MSWHLTQLVVSKADIPLIVSIHEEYLLISRTSTFELHLYIMLSPQTPSQFSGRHHRQNSTPTKPNTSKTNLPTTHRRGLSLDQPEYHFVNHGFSQQNTIFTNVEYTPGQRLIQAAHTQETQPQMMARPGRHQYTYQGDTDARKTMPCLEHGNTVFNNNYMITPTTECGNYAQHSLQKMYHTNTTDYHQFATTTPAGNLDGFGNGLEEIVGNMQPNKITDTTRMPLGMISTIGSRPTSSEGVQQPCTPPSQTKISKKMLCAHLIPIIANVGIAYFPMTPAPTPSSRNAKSTRKIPQSRTTESSPTRRDPNLTIKASHAMQRGASCQDSFAAMRQYAMSSGIPSPPSTAPLELGKSADLAVFPQPNFLNMSSLETHMPPWEGGYNAANYSPMSTAVSSAMSSFQSSPEVMHMSLVEAQHGSHHDRVQAPDLSRGSSSQSSAELGSQSPSAEPEPQPRSKSMSEIEDMNECFEETGVTVDEIASFIFPEAEHSYVCLFPNCRKRFSRKENIKSHVQTHLDDRQYRCRDCSKRFVRQHDLKRHANIHSGVRSYPCPCGKNFARHDALTRHRQRGMCVGAFEGTPKKIMKRGRPKKTRPDPEERREKAVATRQKALENLEKRSPGKYASSISGSSVSAYPSPEQFDSPAEPASSPPELDISSSSPVAPPMLDSDINVSPPEPFHFETDDDPFSNDFDLSESLDKNVVPRDFDDAMFTEYLNTNEMDGPILNDFEFEANL